MSFEKIGKLIFAMVFIAMMVAGTSAFGFWGYRIVERIAVLAEIPTGTGSISECVGGVIGFLSACAFLCSGCWILADSE